MSDRLLPTLAEVKHKRYSRKYGRAYFAVHRYKKVTEASRKRRIAKRVIYGAAVFLVCFELLPGLYFAYIHRPANYELNHQAQEIVGQPVEVFANKLTFDGSSLAYEYNKDYKPNPGTESAGQIAGPRFGAKFETEGKMPYTINDVANNVGITFTPQFGMAAPKQDGNRLIYPIRGLDAQKVVSLKAALVKEDIIVNKFEENELSFKYKIQLPDGLEAKMESSGAVGIYGVQSELLGNVATGSEADAELLNKARENGEKNQLLFTIPAPFVVDAGKKLSKAQASFSLEGDNLTLKAWDLDQASYPLSIDPSVYIETAAKLMRGNNETNVDFDITNELIQKSQTTGARIDAWEDNLDMSQGTFDHATAAASGYVYRVGGRTGPTKPQVVGQQRTLNANASTFTMDMPSVRPAGDLYIAMMCHDGSDGGADTAPGSWTQIADVQGYMAYYKVGTDQGGGNEAASYDWGGYGTEEWAGVIIRITGFDSSDPVSGTPGTGSSSSSTTPVFPATTPDNDATLVVRGAGFDQDDPSDTGWVPSGHTKLDSESSSNGGNGSCGFASATLDTSPASGVSTGTATFADGSVSDDYGASSIAINPVSVTPANQTSVYWAKFNSSTLAIESPTTGDGVCSGWCTDSDYNLPAARRGHSLVAYNGFLYAIGGTDSSCTGTLNACGTVYIAKLGANGEPSLWHPTDTNPNNWVYWYSSGTTLSTDRRYTAAAAYNNRLYLMGGQTDAASGGVNTVEVAEIRPTGDLGSWSTTGMQTLPSARHGHSIQIYNDVVYLVGGNSSGTLQSSVYYSKLNNDGTMNAWVQTTSFTTARSSLGGNYTTVWGGYLYLAGGCQTVNGSGYCTSFANDTQLASINADGSLTEWNPIGNLQNQRIGYSFLAWQGGLYRIGGCSQQNTSTGECLFTLADVDYGVINPAGEVSTVSISSASGSGNCTGGSPYDCDIPTVGDGAGQGGQLLTMSTVLNGYLYIIGGCTDYDCDGTTPAAQDASGNISYSAIDSQGRLVEPPSCGGTSYGSWCVDNTNEINDTGSTATDGIAAGGITTFNGRIYVIGGLTGNGISTNIYYNSVSATDGSLAGAWSSVDMTSAGIAEDVAYTYAYARANPSSAGTYPGNLYLFGGCGNNGGGAGCGSSDYETEVYKCNITTTGSIETADANDCDTSGQLQLDTELADETNQGLGIHSGTVYANYIYLIGGFSPNVSDRDTVFYARFDNSNNVVSVTTGAAGGDADDWIEDDSNLSIGRRRGWAFGYNGHIYAVGGYDAGGGGQIIPFIEWAKINVSDGSIEEFQTSEIQINQRWGLSMVVSNSYAYVIGGCDNGSSPSGCDSFEPAVQTFQLYNNDSGASQSVTAQSDDTFATNTDRWGASSAVLNGYLYVAGGCISATDCTNATSDVQYASLSASDGTVGTWTNASNDLPPGDSGSNGRAWGQLVTAGGYLYYLGGQEDTATNEQSTVYYAGTFSSGDISAAWSTASGGIGDTSGQAAQARTRFGAAVWNNRIYVVGGLDGSAAATSTVYVSPQLNSGGNISADSWTSTTAFNVARSGAAVLAYANNLYLFGGYDGSNYLNDSQFTQINSDGSVDSWTYTTSLPSALRDSYAVAANGYIYLIGGRTAATTCRPIMLVTPISANTTIASGNNPTGVGEWYETNNRYTGDRYGAAVSYSSGKIYLMGGGCSSPLSSTRHYYSNVKSQPMVAKYSRMIDTDTNVFPTKWLMNGLDNSIGARWQMRYRSSTAATASWGQETNFGNVTLGQPENYTPLDSGGSNTNFARYFYFSVSIDASQTFGYPEDVNRGPTLSDITLFFTADPSKRLRHGKTFTGGELQPLDTPF